MISYFLKAPPDVEFYNSNGTSLGSVSMMSNLTDLPNADVIQTINRELNSDGHLIFIVHGFLNDGQNDWISNLRRSIFDRYENKTIIVGVVSWGWGMHF